MLGVSMLTLPHTYLMHCSQSMNEMHLCMKYVRRGDVTNNIGQTKPSPPFLGTNSKNNLRR